jgi:hypothetical protein
MRRNNLETILKNKALKQTSELIMDEDDIFNDKIYMIDKYITGNEKNMKYIKNILEVIIDKRITVHK